MGQKQNIPHVISNFWNFSYDINASQTIYHEEGAQSWLTLHFENCRFNSVNFIEKMHFFRNLQFSKLKILFSLFGMKIILLQIDQKLTFNVFHILNHGHISKIEKNIWWSRPPPKKGLFWGGVWELRCSYVGVCLGPTYSILMHEGNESPKTWLLLDICVIHQCK